MIQVRLTENQTSLKQHLEDRGLDVSKTRVIVDEETDVAVFLLFNLSGELVGYQNYNRNAEKSTSVVSKMLKTADITRKNLKELMKYYTRVRQDQKGVTVWGLETLETDSKILFVTEGIFDAIKIHNAGYPCIATLTNAGSPEIKTFLRMIPQTIISVYDNDESGLKLKSLGDLSFTVPSPAKDLGELDQNTASELINKWAELAYSKRKTKVLKEDSNGRNAKR